MTVLVARGAWGRGACRRLDGVDLLHVAADRASLGDDQRAIANRPRHLAGSVHDEPGARRELARKLAMDLGDVDLRDAIERTRRRDLHFLAVHRRLDMA